jgi:hypothetical protein
MARSSERQRPVKPKSRFFSAPTYERFVEDFSGLLELPPSKLETLLIEAPLLVTSAQLDFETLASKLELSPQEVFSSLRAIRFILQRLQEETIGDNEAQAWADDYIRLTDSNKYELDRLRNLISGLITMADRTFVPFRSYVTARKVFPFFEGSYAAVEMRAVFKSDYSDQGMPPDSAILPDYQPELIGFTPVASVNLDTDIESDFRFLIDEEGLRRLVRTLLACLKELEVAKAACRMPATQRDGT